MLVALVSGALLGSAIWMPQAAPRPDLSGRWTYNAGQSDNPRSLMQRPDSAGGRPGMEGAGGRGAGGGGFRGGRGGFGGRRGGGWGGGGGGGWGRGGGGERDRGGARRAVGVPAPPRPPTARA